MNQIAGQAHQTHTQPLAEQLALAARGLQTVLEGRSARQVVAGWPAASRGGASALLYNALRHYGTGTALLKVLARKKPPGPVSALLTVSLAALLEQEQLHYQPFTVVDQTVRVLRRSRQHGAQAGFANACLRNFLRQRESLLEQVMTQPQACWNHPEWWIQCLQQEYPDHWQQLLEADNRRAPLTLRVNTRKISRNAYLEQLQAAALAARPVQIQGLVLEQACDVRALPGYQQGWFSVQDAGAQRAAAMLLDGFRERRDSHNPDSRLQVLDACAAPGGKTTHLLELAQAMGLRIELVAMDVDGERCQRIADNLARLGRQDDAAIVVADAGAPAQWPASLAKHRPFDAILLDAPCSASGIVRRHADVRWLRVPGDVVDLAQRQAQLLAGLWPLLRTTGRMLYCTCSVFQAEGVRQLRSFLAAHDNARLIAPMLQLLPGAGVLDSAGGSEAEAAGEDDHDGFFYALLEKAHTP